jgi:hypothetical protein
LCLLDEADEVNLERRNLIVPINVNYELNYMLIYLINLVGVLDISTIKGSFRLETYDSYNESY